MTDRRSFSGSLILPIVIFTLLSLAIITVGVVYVTQQTTQLESEIREELSTIALLKMNQIRAWYGERLADAAVVFENPLIAGRAGALVRGLTAEPQSKTTRILKEDLTRWMESRRRNYDYESLLLLDASARVRLSVGFETDSGSEHLRRVIAEAGQRREIASTDLYLRPESGDIWMDIIIPLLSSQDERDTLLTGFVLLRINPKKFLFPLLQTWPTSSPSAESLLLRREGTRVVFLNELRHREGSSMRTTFPVNADSLPAALAVHGQEGIVEGLDYRGVRVLADLRAVTGTPWFLVTKIDSDEVYAPIRSQARNAFFAVISIVALAAAVTTSIWSHQRIKARELLREQEVLLGSVMQNLPVGVWVADSEGKIIMNNPAAQQIWGGAKHVGIEEYGEYRGWWSDTGKKIESGEWALARAIKSGETSLEETIDIECFDGTRKTILNSATPIRNEKGRTTGAIVINQDITIRKHAEQELRRSEERFRAIAEHTVQVVYDYDTATGTIHWAGAIERVTGYTPAEFSRFGIRAWEEHIHPDDAAHALATLNESMNAR